MTPFQMWEYFYKNNLCTKETLGMLVPLGIITEEQYNQILASKPDLTGRVVLPIGATDNTDTAENTENTDPTSQTDTADNTNATDTTNTPKQPNPNC